MNILEELYYGNISPNEKSIREKSEYASYIGIVSDNEEKLSLYLDGEEKRLFDQLMDAQSNITNIEACERFIEGWKLGAQFMLDTFLISRCDQLIEVREK